MKETDRSSQIKKPAIASFDIAKIFFAVCIVALHSDVCDSLPGTMGFWLEKGILRLAVPVFFVMSGVLLGEKLVNHPEQRKNIIRRYCMRLLYPLIVFEAVNIFLVTANSLAGGESVLYIGARILRSVIAYPYGALWYIQACIVGALALYPFIKRNRLREGMVFFGGLYLFGLVCNSYYFCVEGSLLQPVIDGYLKLFVSPRNGLFVGAFFLGGGVEIAVHFTKAPSGVWKKRGKGLLLVSYIVYLTEVYLVSLRTFADDGSLYLSFLFFIPILVMNLYWCDKRISDSLAVAFRNYSVGIYFLHQPILEMIQLYEKIRGNMVPNVVTCAVTLTMAAAICFVVYKYKKEPFVTLLK